MQLDKGTNQTSLHSSLNVAGIHIYPTYSSLIVTFFFVYFELSDNKNAKSSIMGVWCLY